MRRRLRGRRRRCFRRKSSGEKIFFVTGGGWGGVGIIKKIIKMEVLEVGFLRMEKE